MAASPRIYIGRCLKVVGAAIRGKRISNIRGSQPRLATLDSPFQRKGRECGAFRVYQSLLPLEGGARRAEVRGAERSEKGASQVDDLRKHPSAADAVPLPRWERQISSGYAEILRLSSQLFWHSLSHIRRFSPLRMTKRGDARRSAMAGFPRIVSLPLEGKVPRRGG